MKLSLNDEQLMLKDSVARFVKENCGVEVHRQLRDAGELLSEDLWRQMAELGWLALPFAEEDGGLGGSHEELMVLMEELGRGIVVQPYVSGLLTCGKLLAGSEQSLRERFLGPLIAGETQWAFAFAEGQGRYNLEHIATRATAAGDAWVLDGEKVAVINGAGADHLIVTALVGDGGDMGLFVVENPEAAQRRKVPLLDGTPGAQIEFAGTPAILLTEQSLALVESVVDELIIAMGAQALGSMEVLLELTVEYTKTREQFGQSLSKFQALHHRMADMYMHCQALRSLLYDPDAAPGESGRFVSQQAVQLHGGIGMSDELAVGHHFKSLMLLNTLFGDERYHLDRYLKLAD